MSWVGMNLDLSGWIVNPRDLRISVVFRTLEKQSSESTPCKYESSTKNTDRKPFSLRIENGIFENL